MRTNIPRKRKDGFHLNEIHKRNFFGLGEIVGVLTNPAETVRSLTESKRLIDEMRQELSESKERAQIRTRHTFSKLPGFFPRHAEIRAIERALGGEPSFTVLFGASSVGKTALLREVMCSEKYHVLHFDLRIAGFADLSSLYVSLSQQMEQYFDEISRQMEGYAEFEKEAWSFKHDRLAVERRLNDSPEGFGRVRTSDIARLMEMFQSSLLKYWEFQPIVEEQQEARSDSESESTHVEGGPPKSHFRWASFGRRNSKNRTAPVESEPKVDGKKPKEKPEKKMPVIFFDEAHKLPALIRSTEAMKCLLDSMLVLTKQDRLCHVIHATSDPFYQTWLRQLNIMQHCKIITIGDCSKLETRSYFYERILPRVPESLHHRLHFEQLYEAFGGKLAHWHDYVTDFVNSNGFLTLRQSSHFLQAHALLNLHLVHSSQLPLDQPQAHSERSNGPEVDVNSIHPGLGRAGFKIYSPITHPEGPNTHPSGDSAPSPGPETVEFTAMQLLKVLSKLAHPDVTYLPYFSLCRDLGVRAVDGMIKGRVLDLRWTDPVTREWVEEPTRMSSTHPSQQSPYPYDSSGAIPTSPSEEGGAPPTPNAPTMQFVTSEGRYSEAPEVEIVGPKLLPTTPIMKYAMMSVVEEYEDAQSVSEYASLSDVDEY
jgi:hypothetical protein